MKYLLTLLLLLPSLGFADAINWDRVALENKEVIDQGKPISVTAISFQCLLPSDVVKELKGNLEQIKKQIAARPECRLIVEEKKNGNK